VRSRRGAVAARYEKGSRCGSLLPNAGRPYLWGLGIAGADGVAQVVRILRKELELAMALTGRPTLRSIDRSVLW